MVGKVQTFNLNLNLNFFEIFGIGIHLFFASFLVWGLVDWIPIGSHYEMDWIPEVFLCLEGPKPPS